MLPTATSARLGERDMVVLNDLLRFGALTLEQIARRYDLRGRRQLPPLERLKHDGYVKSQPHWFSNTRFFAATDKARKATRSRLAVVVPKPNWVPHDLTMVNLADWLLERHPGSEWRSERELRHGPRQTREWGHAERNGHRPDGVHIVDGRHIGIELELEWKTYEKYAGICRWFAAHLEFHALHWYVKGDLLLERIPHIVAQHGLGPDLDILVRPIPAEVEVLAWPR